VSRQHDLWMLGMTVADILTERHEDEVGAGARDFNAEKVEQVILKLNTDEATQFIAQLRRG